MNNFKQTRRRRNSPLVGLIIILLGVMLLVDTLVPGLYFFNRLFSWPVLLIIIGLYIGSRSGYDKAAPYILIFAGTLFLILKAFYINLSELFWPVILISLGFHLISQRKKNRDLHDWQVRVDDPSIPPQATTFSQTSSSFTEDSANEGADRERSVEEDPATEFTQAQQAEEPYSSHQQGKQSGRNYDLRDDFIDSTSVFGSNKIKVVSKQFKGGNVVNIFGGTEINLLHADLESPAEIEAIQLFGGCTIIAPPHWVIKPEMSSFFGGLEDKRFTQAMPDHRRTLYIRGTSLFGGITIKSA